MQEGTPESAQDVLQDAPTGLTLLDLEGAVFNLEDRWRERPLALVFLRHFG